MFPRWRQKSPVLSTNRLGEEIAKLASSQSEVERKNQDIATEIDTVEKQITSLKHEEQQVKCKLDEENASAREMHETLSVLNQELEKEKSELMDLVTREAQYKNIFQNVTSNKQDLKRRLKRLDEEVLQSQKQVMDCEKRLDDVRHSTGVFASQVMKNVIL